MPVRGVENTFMAYGSNRQGLYMLYTRRIGGLDAENAGIEKTFMAYGSTRHGLYMLYIRRIGGLDAENAACRCIENVTINVLHAASAYSGISFVSCCGGENTIWVSDEPGSAAGYRVNKKDDLLPDRPFYKKKY